MITGASSGLGEALAHVFYSCGCKLILISRRNQELQRVKDALLNTHHVSNKTIITNLFSNTIIKKILI
jgi:short-subunit dehydrogenase